MNGSVRLAILSCAHPHHEAWIRVLRRIARGSLTAIWDDNAERGRAVAAQAGVPFEPDLNKLLARADVDAVAIASENSKHAELTIAAAGAGKHVLCEKPMATTLADCDRMMDAVKRADIKYFQIFPMRHDPVNYKIKELLASGVLGRISVVHKRHGHYFGLEWDKTDPGIWFTNPMLAGGGAFLDEGVHAVDWFRWMFGEPLSVMAQVQTAQTSFAVDDMGVAIYRFPNNLTAVLHSSWLDQAAVATSTIYGEFGTLIQSHTDGASIRATGETSRPLMLYTRATNAWQSFDLPIHFPLNHEAVIEPFLDYVLDGTPPPVTPYDGRRAVEMILAAYESARLGKVVEFA